MHNTLRGSMADLRTCTRPLSPLLTPPSTYVRYKTNLEFVLELEVGMGMVGGEGVEVRRLRDRNLGR
jgi:hypothetical protein